MAYGSFERRLGGLLDAFPQLRGLAKSAYQRVNYYIAGRHRAPLVLHPEVEMEDVCSADASSTGQSCFFGYFATSPWSPDGRHFLVHRLIGARPGTIEICIRDNGTHAVRKLGESQAWTFQQGSLAQWLTGPGEPGVAFNDVADGELGCRIVALNGAERRLSWPMQALRPDGLQALSVNFRRLWHVSRDYGYRVESRNLPPDLPPDRDGIWQIDIPRNTAELTVTIADLMAHAPRPDMAGAAHEVNHAAYSPSGARFVFMHRWNGPRGRRSRLFCADRGATAPRLVWDQRMVSHYAWQDDHSLLLWADHAATGLRYYLLNVVSGQFSVVGGDVLDRLGDGHPSFSPDRRWIVTDTYPDRAQHRHLLLWDCAGQRLVEIGSFFAPWRFRGDARCDLHPRWNRDGSAISIDSAHEGIRRSYVVDVSRIVGR